MTLNRRLGSSVNSYGSYYPSENRHGGPVSTQYHPCNNPYECEDEEASIPFVNASREIELVASALISWIDNDCKGYPYSKNEDAARYLNSMKWMEGYTLEEIDEDKFFEDVIIPIAEQNLCDWGELIEGYDIPEIRAQYRKAHDAAIKILGDEHFIDPEFLEAAE